MLNILKILTRLVIPVAILLWSAACSRQPRHEATYAYVRSIIDSVPERALEILDSIPADRLQPGLDSARYILLHATAEDKLHNITTSDSLLKYILPIFKENNLTQETIHANYILGSFLTQKKEFNEALEYLMAAEDQMDENTTSYEKGLIYHTIADCYVNFLNGPSAIEYVDKAAVEFTKANLPTHYLYALNDKGIFLNNGQKYKEAECQFNQVLDSLKIYDEEPLLYWCYDGLFRSMMGQQRHKEALKYYQLLSQTTDSIDDITIGLMLIAERYAGSKEKADSLAASLLKSGNSWVMNEDNITSLPSEYLSKALYDQNKYTDELILNSYRESYPVLLRKNINLNKQLNKELRLNKKLIHIIYLSIVIILTVFIGGTVYILTRKWKYQKELNQCLFHDFISFIQDYNRSSLSPKAIEATEIKIEKDSELQPEISRNIISNLLEKHALSLNTVIDVYYNNPDLSAQENKKVLKFINETAKSLTKNKEVLREFEEIINVKYDGILNRFKVDINDSTEEELHIFVLSVAGFSNMAIAHILKIASPNFVAVKKSGLRKKINNQLPLDIADSYIRIMQ